MQFKVVNAPFPSKRRGPRASMYAKALEQLSMLQSGQHIEVRVPAGKSALGVRMSLVNAAKTRGIKLQTAIVGNRVHIKRKGS